MIEVKAWRDWEFQRVRVLIRDTDTGLIFGKDHVYRQEEFPDGLALPDEAFALELPDRHFEQIVAALNELVTNEKAPGDAYALRRDLDREHGRVDKLQDVLIEQLRAAASGMDRWTPSGS